MIIRKTFKYRLYPTKEQETKLFGWLDLNRELYNAALQERRDAYKMAGKSLNYNHQTGELAAVREVRPEFYAVPITVLRGTLKRLDRAFQAFFLRVKTGQKPGFPRFQGKNRFDSFTYSQLNGALKFTDRRIALPMFGPVKIKLHRPLEGTAKTLTIRHDAGQWYIAFSCEVESAALPVLESTVGIDLGVSALATLSTGEKIENPRHYRRAAQLLTTKQQQLSCCKKGSHHRDRVKRAVARQHAKVRRQRADFLHKVSRRLVNEYGTIVFEQLQPQNMSKRAKPKLDETATAEQGTPVYAPNGQAAKSGLNKSILDAGWGMLQQMCVVKAEWAGRRVLFVNPRYTSQLCSGCGRIVKKELAQRWHSCECGTELDRDHNAAINILRAGERPTRTPLAV